jgi:hypothetical protein
LREYNGPKRRFRAASVALLMTPAW